MAMPSESQKSVFCIPYKTPVTGRSKVALLIQKHKTARSPGRPRFFDDVTVPLCSQASSLDAASVYLSESQLPPPGGAVTCDVDESQFTDLHPERMSSTPGPSQHCSRAKQIKKKKLYNPSSVLKVKINRPVKHRVDDVTILNKDSDVICNAETDTESVFNFEGSPQYVRNIRLIKRKRKQEYQTRKKLLCLIETMREEIRLWRERYDGLKRGKGKLEQPYLIEQ